MRLSFPGIAHFPHHKFIIPQYTVTQGALPFQYRCNTETVRASIEVNDLFVSCCQSRGFHPFAGGQKGTAQYTGEIF